MRRRFLRAFAIRPDEAHRVGWLLLHSVFVGLFVAFFISAANALFLARFEAASLPYAYMAAGLVGSLVMGLFGRLRRRLAWMNLLVSYLVFLVIAVGCLYLAALRSDSRWIPFSLFVLLSPGLTLVYLEFWTLAGRLFDLRQSKRFFALVSSGEVISSIVGFFLVPVLTALLGAALHLLPIAILGLVGSIAVVAVIRRRFGHELHDAGHDEGKPAAQAQGAARWRDRYFALTALMMGCVFVTLYLVDFGFLSQVRGHYAGAEQVAGFLGVFFGSAKILELVMKSLVSGRLLSQFGLRTALLVLPGTLLLCALAAVAAGIFPGPATTGFFLLVAGAKLLWLVLRKSVFEPSSKVLYQPLPVTERMTFQTRIEGNVRQTATFVGGIVLLALSRSGAHALGPWLFLLPVLGTMLVLAAALHRQYRRKLLEALGNLSLGHVVPTPLERIKQALDGARPLLVQHTLSTLENIEPGLSEQLRGDLPDAHQPPGTLGIPPQTDDGTASTAQVVAWASSRDAGDRRSAAAALARRGGEAAERALLSLLWDEDPAVRRAAVIAAGKTGNPQYWPRLIDLLSQGLYAKFASAALISVGEPILRPLDESCRPDGRQIATLVRILRIYQRIGGEAAQRYLLRRIHHLSRHVRRQVFVSLAALDYQARPEEVPWIKQRIEELVGGITWYVAARRDLGTGPAVAEVVHAIDWEIERDTELLYLALALVCEPQALKLVRENLGGGDEAANAYGLEVADEVMPPELKSLLHPIFEQLRPAQLLDRLDLAFPQSSLDRAGRLAEILRLGGSRVNPWLRACAIDALIRLGPSGVPDELVANLFSAHPLVKEMAAWGIHRIDPAALDRHLPRLAEDERTALDPLVRGGPQELLRGWDKVLILRRIPVFAPIPEVALAGFANAVEELHPAAGETIFRQGEVGREMYVIVDGMVRIDIDDVAVAELGEADVVGEIAIVGTGVRNATATAGKPTRLLRLDQALLYDLMADNLEVVPEIVRVVSERSASAGASAPPGTR